MRTAIRTAFAQSSDDRRRWTAKRGGVDINSLVGESTTREVSSEEESPGKATELGRPGAPGSEQAASNTAVALGITTGGPLELKNLLDDVGYSAADRGEGEGGCDQDDCDHEDSLDECENGVSKSRGGGVVAHDVIPNSSSNPRLTSMLPSAGKLSTGGEGVVTEVGLSSSLGRPIDTKLDLGVDMAGVGDLGEGDMLRFLLYATGTCDSGDGEPFRFALNSKLSVGHLAVRFDGEGISSSSSGFELHPTLSVNARFRSGTGAVRVLLVEGSTTEGVECEGRSGGVGRDGDR